MLSNKFNYTKSIVISFFAVGMLTACEMDYDTSINDYKNNPTGDTTLKITENISVIQKRNPLPTTEDLKYIDAILSLATDKKDYKLISYIAQQANNKEIIPVSHKFSINNKDYNLSYIGKKINGRHSQDKAKKGFSFSLTDDELSKLNEDKSLNNALLLNELGDWRLRQKNILEAYDYYTKAALIDEKYAASITGFLKYFGCEETRLVWSSLSEMNRDFDLGEKYPELPLSKDFNLAAARKALTVNHQSPQLQANCPINAYKNK